MARPIAKKPQLSPQEKTYNVAVGLLEALDCVARFEQKEASLKSAAKKFGKLGDFKDAKKLQGECLELREKVIKEGTADVFGKAQARQESAKTKSEYVDAIENYRRVIKYQYQVEECKKRIRECERQIGRIETKLVWKRRFTALLGLILFVGLVMLTPVYPMIKGIVHQYRGEYRAAINCYKSIDGGLGTTDRMETCYFYLGEEQYKKGNDKKALRLYKKAAKAEKAPERACEIEVNLMRGAKTGDSIWYGSCKWIVLEVQGDGKLLLMRKEVGTKTAFDDGTCSSFATSSLCRNLNVKFPENHLSKVEQEMLVSNGSVPIPESEQNNIREDGKKVTEIPLYFSELSREQYEKYKTIINQAEGDFWLSDYSDGQAGVVTAAGSVVQGDVKDSTKHSRPVCSVSLAQHTSESKN